MKEYTGEKFRAHSLKLDDLNLLQCCGDDDLDYEIEQSQKLADKYHRDFYQMSRFCEHLAQTYFLSELRCEQFIIKMDSTVPIHDDLDGWEIAGIPMDDFLDKSDFIS